MSNESLSNSGLRLVSSTTPQGIDTIDDCELVRRCQQKDQRAFDLLVKRHQRTVTGLLYRLAPDWDNHADLAQEVFIRMWRNIHKLKNPRAFKSWITQITTHLFYDELRKKPRQMRLVSMDEPVSYEDNDDGATRDIVDKSAGPEELMQRQELRAVVHGAMSQLSEQFRTAIVLREVNQLSYEEIATITNSELGTVKSRIARARTKVQELVSPYLEKKAA